MVFIFLAYFTLWALFFFTICRELPQATSHFIFKLCSYSRHTSVTDEKKKKETSVTDDEATV